MPSNRLLAECCCRHDGCHFFVRGVIGGFTHGVCLCSLRGYVPSAVVASSLTGSFVCHRYEPSRSLLCLFLLCFKSLSSGSFFSVRSGACVLLAVELDNMDQIFNQQNLDIFSLSHVDSGRLFAECY